MLTTATIKIPPFLSAVLLSLAWASPAQGDPCEGALPAAGAIFRGEVRYVGDGDGFCLGPADRPDHWIEVRLGDFFAPELQERGGGEAKSRLEQLVMGRVLVCRAGRRSYDRVIGFCTLAGKPVGDLLRARGGIEAGRGWHSFRSR